MRRNPSPFEWRHYAPEINLRMRPHLRMSGASFRIDETCVKIGKGWKYLYRAVDKDGAAIEFMLSAKRDVSAAKRFFKKLRLDGRDAIGQAKFVESLFGVAAEPPPN